MTRSVRDTAAFLREAECVYRRAPAPAHRRRHPARPQAAPDRRPHRRLGRACAPEVTELTLKTAQLLEELGHQVEEVAAPGPAYVPDDFLLYWAMLAMMIVRTGRRSAGRPGTASRLDNLTLGLDRHAPQPAPAARARSAGCAALQAVSARLPPDVRRRADAHARAPRRPWSGTSTRRSTFDAVMERILEWVTFTPWQNATGDPAVSLPLATTAAGLPQGMMFSAGAGREATPAGARATSSRRPLRGPRSGPEIRPVGARVEGRFLVLRTPVYSSPSLPL